MERILQEQYKEITLQELTDKINMDWYASLKKLCESAEKQADKLNGLELQQSTSQYTTLCTKLIAEIEACLLARTDFYIPYILQLSKKAEELHDCSNCTGNCRLNHDVQLLELKASHNNIKNILYRLQMVSLPLYSETIYPDAYRVLRNQMALIENGLTELFFLEGHYLIPRVTEAQNQINAGG